MHFLAERVRHNGNNLPKDMVDYPSFSVFVRRLNFEKLNRNYVCQAEAEGRFFWCCCTRPTENQTAWTPWSFPASKVHEWFQISCWGSKHSQSFRIRMDHTVTLHLWSSMSTLISVFPQSATFKMEFLIVWRARDGQVGEGIIAMAYPSSGGPQCIWDNIFKTILAPLLVLLF